MACILHIETSTDTCSVALSERGSVLHSDVHREGGPSHASALAPMVADALSFAESHAIPLDAVAYSEGPGSYTGLRIGLSEAKGVCYGRGVPLIAVSTLQLLCVGPLLTLDLPDDALICPMLDARRMEVYAALYDRALQEVRPAQADIIDEHSYADYLEQHPVWFFGPGAEKCKSVIRHPAAHFVDDVVPLAQNMMPLAEMKFLRQQFADVAYAEPFYLKEYVAAKPKNALKGL